MSHVLIVYFSSIKTAMEIQRFGFENEGKDGKFALRWKFFLIK